MNRLMPPVHQGRSTSRSMTSASMIMTTMVMAKCSRNEKTFLSGFPSTAPAQRGDSTMAPWAK